MTVSGFRWVRVSMTLGLVIGSSLCCLSGRALAQPNSLPKNTFLGDSVCGLCHQQEFAEYAQSGHPWMSVHTGGKTPDPLLFSPIGLPVPDPAKFGTTWDQVQDIVANFKPAEDGEPTPAGLLLTNGKFLESNGFSLTMPGRCNKCHNTGGDANGTGGNSSYNIKDLNGNPIPNPNIQGSWVLSGVQCEQCHGPNGTMTKPGPNGFIVDANGNPTQLTSAVAAEESTSQVFGDCRDCHSSGSTATINGEKIPFVIPIATSAAYIAGQAPAPPAAVSMFNNHHPQGDEYRRSPHKNEGCTLCHDPHLSVWRDQGGVVSPNGANEGTMCTNCHSERVQANVYAGGMAAAGIECTQCHMPRMSAGGTRTAHLFRINGNPVTAAQNLLKSTALTGKVDANKNPLMTDSYYWRNLDGTVDPNGDSSLTLDLVCTQCHQNMSIQNMSNAAPFIHRANGMTYLQVNWQTDPLTIRKTQKATVAFSIAAGKQKGVRADCFVMMYGPKGWSSWNGTKWVAGQHAWKTRTALSDVRTTIPFNSTLLPGAYTFYVRVHTAAKDYNSYAKVKVTKQ